MAATPRALAPIAAAPWLARTALSATRLQLRPANAPAATIAPAPAGARCLTAAARPAVVCRRPLLHNQTPKAFGQLRWRTTLSGGAKLYDFDSIKQLVEQPSPERILIDVREPSEVKDGKIPTSVNVPVNTRPDAILLPAHEFEEQFGFPKPSAEQEVVFYCKAGVRSSAAAKIAEQAGYSKIGDYKGSWLDWTAKGGAVEK